MKQIQFIFQILLFLIYIKSSECYITWNNITIDEAQDNIILISEWNSTNNSFFTYTNNISYLISPFQTYVSQHSFGDEPFQNISSLFYLGNNLLCFVCLKNYPIFIAKIEYNNLTNRADSHSNNNYDNVTNYYKCGIAYDNQFFYIGVPNKILDYNQNNMELYYVSYFIIQYQENFGLAYNRTINTNYTYSSSLGSGFTRNIFVYKFENFNCVMMFFPCFTEDNNVEFKILCLNPNSNDIRHFTLLGDTNITLLEGFGLNEDIYIVYGYNHIRTCVFLILFYFETNSEEISYKYFYIPDSINAIIKTISSIKINTSRFYISYYDNNNVNLFLLELKQLKLNYIFSIKPIFFPTDNYNISYMKGILLANNTIGLIMKNVTNWGMSTFRYTSCQDYKKNVEFSKESSFPVTDIPGIIKKDNSINNIYIKKKSSSNINYELISNNNNVNFKCTVNNKVTLYYLSYITNIVSWENNDDVQFCFLTFCEQNDETCIKDEITDIDIIDEGEVPNEKVEQEEESQKEESEIEEEVQGETIIKENDINILDFINNPKQDKIEILNTIISVEKYPPDKYISGTSEIDLGECEDI